MMQPCLIYLHAVSLAAKEVGPPATAQHLITCAAAPPETWAGERRKAPSFLESISLFSRLASLICTVPLPLPQVCSNREGGRVQRAAHCVPPSRRLRRSAPLPARRRRPPTRRPALPPGPRIEDQAELCVALSLPELPAPKEMIQPCLIYLHAISLVWAVIRSEEVATAPPPPPRYSSPARCRARARPAAAQPAGPARPPPRRRRRR